MLLASIEINLIVPRMINFPLTLSFLISEKQIYNLSESLFACYMQACCTLVGDLKWYFTSAQFFKNMSMTIKRGIVQCIESFLVFDFFISKLIFHNDLHNDFITETASQHQWSDAIWSYWKVHINIRVQCTQIKQILEIIIIDSSKNFLLPCR